MRKIPVSKATAARVMGTLAVNGYDAARAANDVRVGLRAIEPYTDRRASAALVVLDRLAAVKDPARFDALVTSLRTLAA